jgi:hypothetical protein
MQVLHDREALAAAVAQQGVVNDSDLPLFSSLR